MTNCHTSPHSGENSVIASSIRGDICHCEPRRGVAISLPHSVKGATRKEIASSGWCPPRNDSVLGWCSSHKDRLPCKSHSGKVCHCEPRRGVAISLPHNVKSATRKEIASPGGWRPPLNDRSPYKPRWGDIFPCESRNGEAIHYRIRERMPYEKRLLRRAGALLAMTNCHVCLSEYLVLVPWNLQIWA